MKGRPEDQWMNSLGVMRCDVLPGTSMVFNTKELDLMLQLGETLANVGLLDFFWTAQVHTLPGGRVRCFIKPRKVEPNVGVAFWGSGITMSRKY